MADIMIFKRYEKKYRLSENEYRRLMGMIRDRLVPDEHGRNTLCSLYLDTSDFLLIRNSIDAISYKEKLRLRSYGVPDSQKKIFFEIKKKYKGVVYKRRVSMTRDEAFDYIESLQKPFDSQIMREIDYLMKLYRNPKPTVCILCEREAYFDKDTGDIRLTFDENLRYRTDFPSEDNILEGTPIVKEGEYILEIKTPGAMPLWLAHALSECEIYPAKFSKYAHAYYDIKSTSEELKYEFVR
jgi:hypothetical protein